MQDLQIKELDLAKIMPNSSNMHNPEQGGSKIVVIGKPGTGKCLGVDTPILLHDLRVKKVQDILIGDRLLGDDGRDRFVRTICTGYDMLYRVIPIGGGKSYVCNGEHVLVLREINPVFQDQPSIVESTCEKLYECQKKWNKKFGGYSIFIKNDTFPIVIEKVGKGDYYGFEIDGNGRFCLGDGTVTHNTTLITRLLYEKSNIFPTAFVMSGTEDSNGHYSKIMPSTFVHNKYDEEKVNQFITRQKIAKKHLPVPWSVLLLDDCTDDPRIFNKPQFQGLYKNGRHWKMLFFLSLQMSNFAGKSKNPPVL